MEHDNIIIMLALIALVAIVDAVWNRRFDKLLNRFMAGDYKMFRYYEDKYAKDIKAVETVRKVEKTRMERVMETMAKDDAEHPELEQQAEDDFNDELYGQPVILKTKPDTENEEI